MIVCMNHLIYYLVIISKNHKHVYQIDYIISIIIINKLKILSVKMA